VEVKLGRGGGKCSSSGGLHPWPAVAGAGGAPLELGAGAWMLAWIRAAIGGELRA
jgi:hypothetical protein